MLSIKEVMDSPTKMSICGFVLRDFPELYIDNAFHNAGRSVSDTTVYAAFNEMEEPIGLVSVKRTAQGTAEILALGVMKAYQNRRAGATLLKLACDYCASRDIKYLTCRVLNSASSTDKYGAPRSFLEHRGFIPLGSAESADGSITLIKDLGK